MQTVGIKPNGSESLESLRLCGTVVYCKYFTGIVKGCVNGLGVEFLTDVEKFASCCI